MLSTCKEFALGWKGWVGLVAILCPLGTVAFNLVPSHPNWSILCSGACLLAFIVLWLIESLKLSKAFGKGAGVGILLILFQSLGRFVLGLSKAQYQKSVVD